ncbi:DEK domain-containing chromatin-associated protein 3-like [Nicotiana tomentosiformis]|uniref:DEK domain-containing chromatin-associated protein 3-like n=1 Tax=Nicotiana tomentosiformis TaxID=4098 RepID=UPI00388C9746
MDNDDQKSENERDSGEDKKSEAEDKIDEQVDDSGEEEKNSEEEGDDEESEEDNENIGGESEGSMAIGNTVIAPSEDASREKRTEGIGPLSTPFTRDEEVSNDEDNLSMSAVGKKNKKTLMKATKFVIHGRKEMVLPARTPLTRSKIKVVDEQIIKESRGSKKPRKKVSIVELVVELDAEDESNSALPEKSSAQKRKAFKSTKIATPSKRANRGKERKSVPVVVDKLTEFRN